EQRGDIDDANAADLHVVALELVPAGDEDVVAASAHVDQIVRHQAMPSFHQVQHAFALADPAPAHHQQAYAVDVGHGAVYGRAGSEHLLEVRLDPPVEVARLHGRPEHGYAAFRGLRDQPVGHLESLRDDHARGLQGEQPLQ